jgi:hypothetical protein
MNPVHHTLAALINVMINMFFCDHQLSEDKVGVLCPIAEATQCSKTTEILSTRLLYRVFIRRCRAQPMRLSNLQCAQDGHLIHETKTPSDNGVLAVENAMAT